MHAVAAGDARAARAHRREGREDGGHEESRDADQRLLMVSRMMRRHRRHVMIGERVLVIAEPPADVRFAHVVAKRLVGLPARRRLREPALL